MTDPPQGSQKRHAGHAKTELGLGVPPEGAPPKDEQARKEGQEAWASQPGGPVSEGDSVDASGVSSALADLHGDNGALVGEVLNGLYELEEVIGVGGMGAVYSAKHVHLQKRFAVKVFRNQLAAGKAALERFRHEAIAASRIDHPHIIDVVNFDTAENGTAFLVMELLRGQNLAEVLKHGALPLARAIDIVLQVGDALAAAHAHGIVHRDLKPENIFIIEKNGRDLVKILDFGISKMRAEGEEQVRITRTGQLLGTPRYMSPEQAMEDGEVDHRADVYALGAILYEMVCGEPPFEGRNYAQLIYQHASVTPTPPSQRNSAPSLPGGVEQAILCALEKRPEERFDSVADMMDALRAATSQTGELEPAIGGLGGRPARRAGRRALVPVAAAGAAAVALAAWFLWSDEDGQSTVPAASASTTLAPDVHRETVADQPSRNAVEQNRDRQLQLEPEADTHRGPESGKTAEANDRRGIARRESRAKATTAGPGPGQVVMRFVSRPKGAEVWVQGKLLGTTPLATPVEATENKLRIRFKAIGHREHVTWVRPEQGGEVSARLTRSGQPKAGSRQAGPPPRALPIKKEL